MSAVPCVLLAAAAMFAAELSAGTAPLVETTSGTIRAAIIPITSVPWREALMIGAPFVGTVLLRRGTRR